MRRRILTSGIITVTAVLALSACTGTKGGMGTGTGESGKSTTPAKAPAAELADAAVRLKTETFKMTMTFKAGRTDARLVGSMDPTKKISSFTATNNRSPETAVAEWRVIGNVVYLKSNTPNLTGNKDRPWRRITAGVTGGSVAQNFDGAEMANPLTQAASVRRTSARQFTGTFKPEAIAQALNLPTPSTGPSGSPEPTVAFTADLDDRGRLIRYHLDIPLTKGRTYPMELTYSDFGVPVSVEAPPENQIAKAPGD